MSIPFELPGHVQAWLQPLNDPAAGPDLEYDPEFLELFKAAEGTPETQFAPAEPPKWKEVQAMAESMLGRTRDLRVAMVWLRASLYCEGVAGLANGLGLISGLLNAYWDLGLHPQLDPDDGDSFARLSPLATLERVDGLIADLRQALVHPDRRLGGLRVRDIEVGLNRLPAREDEDVRSEAVLRSMLLSLSEVSASLRADLARIFQACSDLEQALQARVSSELRVDLKPLRQILSCINGLLPAEQEGDQPSDPIESGDDPVEAHPTPVGASRLRGPVSSREEAVQAIQAICDYLERQEPTNPAQLLLRRAMALIDRNFMQLVRELAPDSLREVARVMGIDPDAIP